MGLISTVQLPNMHWPSMKMSSAISQWILFLLLLLPAIVHSEPISVDFNLCQSSEYPLQPIPNSPTAEVQCCPVKTTEAAIDGLPPPTTDYLRVREAFQCTDAAYTQKLRKAYALMRALPDDDPRSFLQQWYIHCSYCGGAFYMTDPGSNSSRGIDVHFSWLFLPWHRLFVYFHERILQSLLGDTSFSLNYWNWDNPYTVRGGSYDNACLKVGHFFPSAYADSSQSTYDPNRSESAKGRGPLDFPDLSFNPTLPAAQQPLYNAPAEEVIANNLNLMYNNFVSGGTTAELFMGVPYRAGDLRGNPGPTGGGGSFELGVHGGPHFWTGQDPPNMQDMGSLAYSARDPVFFSHHSNVDRLFKVWKDIGPLIGQNHEYFTDPDFLDASFVFYDENKVLRRVTVADSLDTDKLGYTYQPANDAVWLYLNQTRCSNISYSDLLSRANSLTPPPRNSAGNYYLTANTSFILVIDYVGHGSGKETFLTIDGIRLNRQLYDGFDVYVDWLYPNGQVNPRACAEYVGRFFNMAQGRRTITGNDKLKWSSSISRKIDKWNLPASADKVVVTIVPLATNPAQETISFSSVSTWTA